MVDSSSYLTYMSNTSSDKGPIGLISRVIHYVELRLDYGLLQAESMTKRMLSTFWIGMVYLFLGSLCISFIGVALAFGLHEWLNHWAWSFLLVALVMIGLLFGAIAAKPLLEKMLMCVLDSYFQALTLREQRQSPTTRAENHAQSTLNTGRDATDGKRNEELSRQH
jgi:hypothetical protein